MNSESPIKFKYVDFDLPFVLFLNDSLGDKDLEKWAAAYRAGEQPLPYSRYAPSTEKPGGFVIGGGFPVYLPPKELSPYYEVNLPHIQVGIRTLKRVNPHRNSQFMSELPGDRNGKASFSSVRAMFDLQQFEEEHYWNMEMFCSLSISAINHFINHYRVIANRSYIVPVTVAEIQEFHLITENEDGEKRHQEFGASSGPLRGFGGAIEDKLDAKLRLAVELPEPPPIGQTFESNINNYLDHNEWRLVIIEVAVLFEMWLTGYVRSKFVDNGLSQERINEEFKNSRGFPKSITAVAKQLVKQATGIDFSITTEYKNWESKVRDPRNELIHGQRFNFTQLDANESYQAAKDAFSILSTY